MSISQQTTATSSVFASSGISPAPRFDMYGTIHKALRSFMNDTLWRVGRMDVHDVEEMDAALAQLFALLTECAAHVRHENDFVHVAIEARQPGGSERMAGEHVEHRASIEALRDEARELRGAPAAQRDGLAHRLYQHLSLFVAHNFEHMHYEETVHNATLWSLYSDAELHGIHGRLLESVPPDELLQVVRWMVPAMNPAERTALLSDIKATAPAPAFDALVAHVRPHLDAAGWKKLAAAVGIAMPAEEGTELALDEACA